MASSGFDFKVDERVPLLAEADVIVVGGGPGGLGAAVMAARAGARTVLVERFGSLGGMASVGEVNPFMPNHYSSKGGAVCMDRPVYLEWTRAIASYLPERLRGEALADAEAAGQSRTIGKDAAALAAEDLCLAAGVKLVYHHTLVKAPTRQGAVEALVFSSKSGFGAMKAKVYVDSSGDGDLAALSGCSFEFGGPDGHCQPMTLCFKLSHVDAARMPEGGEVQRLYQKAKAEGVLDCPRESLLYFGTYDRSVVHFNTTRVVGLSAIDGLELSAAEIEGRRQFRQCLAWLRSDVPGFEEAQIHSLAAHIGVRETRRVKGLAYIGRADFMRRAKFPDAIARCNYPIDIHSTSGAGTELTHMSPDEFYEIPYGCVVPQDVSNLTIGSRCVSVDHAAHSSMRVMPPVCSVGQAAGLAAALAARRGVSPARLDGVEVRERLKEQGAWL